MIRALSIVAMIGMLGCFALSMNYFHNTNKSMRIAFEVYREVNFYREKYGIDELKWDNELEALAMWHSNNMKKADELSYPQYPGIVNVAKGSMTFTDNQSVMGFWISDFDCRRKMLDTDVRYIGVGIKDNYATLIARERRRDG